MAPLALLYDMHGNLAALRAVLDDARGQGAASFVLGGDYALFGPRPAETLAALRDLPRARWIRGNGERWTASPDEAPEDPVVQGAIASCREALGAEAVRELARLPETATEDDVLYCHGSPASDVRSFMPEPADDEPELLEGVHASRLVFGHTHLPFRRAAGGVELVNPGSVGMPFDGDPRAAYALVAADGEVEHRRVDYDHLGAAVAVRDRFDGEWTQTVAGRIERAAF
jgi:predicted phosphodiesterase